MTINKMTKPQILKAIETLQEVQQTNSPKTTEWKEASVLLNELYAEMHRREPQATRP